MKVAHSHGHHPPPGGHVGVHGMVVFGTDHFSHLPMFHEPHDYQAVMRVSLSHPGIEPGESFGDELHTFVPDELSLGDLLSGELTDFEGTLWKGSFEGEGEPLHENVKVHVERVLDSRHLEAGSRGPEDLEYVMYGRPGDTYLVHPIFGNADFDQILKVESAAGFSAEELHEGVRLSLPGRANTVQTRLREGESARLAAQGREVGLRVVRELSCLVGPHFTQGPEE